MAPSSAPTPAATSTPAATPPPTPSQRLLIIDEKNMLPLWLEEKVARRELTPAEADKMLSDQETQGKLWTGPIKDAFGSGRLFYKLARDFASWKGAKVYFAKSKAGQDLVIFKGWPSGRKIITGTRYRLDNPKIIEMQIGRPGLFAAAKESARFGVYLVVAVDVADYIFRDQSTLGSLLASLTVDIPSVLLASAVGAVAGSFVSGTSVVGLAAVGSLACGPLLVAFGVGVLAGFALAELDDNLHLTHKLTEAFNKGLAKLSQVWGALGQEADTRFRQLANSQTVHDLRQETHVLAERIGRQADWVRGELTYLW